MSFPKATDVQKNLELKKKQPHEAEYKRVTSILTGQMNEMAKSGEIALHTDDIRGLGKRDPDLVSRMIDELEENGFTVRKTDLGHQITWPGEEVKDDFEEARKEALASEQKHNIQAIENRAKEIVERKGLKVPEGDDKEILPIPDPVL